MGRLHDLLTRDHERLDALLASSSRSDGTVEQQPYGEFRRGLLRHIGIEERILFPVVRRTGGDLRTIEQLHRDHAVLSALLVPPPTTAELDAIRTILAVHNPLEEDDGGFYDGVEAIAGDELDDLLARIEAYPDVRVAPHADNDILRRTIAQLLREAEEGRKKL